MEHVYERVNNERVQKLGLVLEAAIRMESRIRSLNDPELYDDYYHLTGGDTETGRLLAFLVRHLAEAGGPHIDYDQIIWDLNTEEERNDG